MKKTLAFTAVALAFAASSAANAANFTFSGNLTDTNQVITTAFTLTTAATNVRVWTDSFNSGGNFDPIVAVFDANTGALLAQNDDNPSVASGQTFFDSGIVFSSLAAGNYFFSMARFPNFANGNNFADGFRFSGTGTPLTSGNFYRVNLSGVDSAAVVGTPIPAAAWLFGTGLVGLAGLRRKVAA